jgi:peptidoglycan/LPS O-acetylase OafA/YrhL
MRMKQLDTLRAFAILLVMIEHFGGKTLNDHFPIGAGAMGVGLFFTLSGFLITGILLQSFDSAPDKARAWRDFYARRLLRLVPPYYAVIAGLLLLGIAPLAQSWPWDLAYLTNVNIARGGPETVFWSLAVEEQFYLFWPFVIAFVPRRFLVHTILALAAVTLLFRLGVWLGGYNTRTVGRLLPGNLILLGSGCLLAATSYRGGRANCFDWYTPNLRRWFSAAALLALALAILSWSLFPKEGGMVRYFTNDLLCGTFYAWLVLEGAIGVRGKLAPLFDNGVLQYIGRISYGLYLVHNWMPDIVTKVFGPLPKHQAAPLVLAGTFGICALSWQFFEKPVMGLKRFFGNPERNEPFGSSTGTDGTLPGTAPLMTQALAAGQKS